MLHNVGGQPPRQNKVVRRSPLKFSRLMVAHPFGPGDHNRYLTEIK